MKRGKVLMLAALLGLAGVGRVQAGELADVHGSKVRFTTTMEVKVDGKPVRLALTGTALRQKYFLNVYALASYLQEGVQVQSAEELAAADCVKQLHLVLERNISGKDMAEAFQEAIRHNYPEPALKDEVAQLADMLRNDSFHQGDHIYLTHQPGLGLRISVSDRDEVIISNAQMSRAIWDIYLGPNNLGDSIKKGLLSRR
jgi:hypothetical protein